MIHRRLCRVRAVQRFRCAQRRWLLEEVWAQLLQSARRVLLEEACASCCLDLPATAGRTWQLGHTLH